MKKSMLFIFITVLASCAENEYTAIKQSSESLREVSFAAEIAGEECVQVKSILSAGVETKMSDVTLASYGSDGMLKDVRYYDSGFDSMPLLVESVGSSNIYALVNMGDMSVKFPESESAISGIEYYLQSYYSIDNKGFPMSGALSYSPLPHSRGIIEVHRLFAKLCVRITHRSLDGYTLSSPYAYNMCNKSLYLRQANRRLLPFSDNGSKALKPSDILGLSDNHQNLNDRNAYPGSLSQGALGPGPGYAQDTTLVFYVPENVQGNLLPQNDDPYAKVYDAISDIDGRSYSDLCTYLEFNARRENTLGYSGEVMYRYYLGADNTSDFSLVRNKRYDITLDFTEEGFFAENWKVTRGDDWNDQRILKFVEEPFSVCPGGTVDIMVHYNRSGIENADSHRLPDEWRMEVEQAAMGAAGLSYSFDPSSLSVGKNGYKDFCIKVSASKNARIGAVVPLQVTTNDGGLADETVVSVVENDGFTPVWDFRPEYVSQEGILMFPDVRSDDLPLSVSLSDPSKASCISVSDRSFRIVALRPGVVTVNVTNSCGTKHSLVPIDIKTPRLKVNASSLILNPDGETASVTYLYLDAGGKKLTNINASAFDSHLLPVMEAGSYFQPTVNSTSVSMKIVSLTADGEVLCLGKEYVGVLRAADCPAVASETMILKVKDPFDGMAVRDYGTVNDYTLFALNGVEDDLRSAFSDEIDANKSFEYPAFVPDADRQYVSAVLEPLWTTGFSNRNDVFKADLNVATGKVRLTAAAVTSVMEHSVGKHNLMLYVMNRHSHEKVGRSCGSLDVYVHTALGAKAVFGSQRCNYNPYGNETFASIYNRIAGCSVYPSPTSSSMIHYMDVSMDWMTDVSRVYVLNRMKTAAQSGTSWMDALDIIRPSVSDGDLNSNTRMLYSVMDGSDSRISVCGEKYGARKGIGRVLYRALLQPTYNISVTDTDRKQWFFGYQSYTGRGTPAMAPCYTLHNMNIGSDMNANKVASRSPYYFSPSSCGGYVDDMGRGYHVIHFLEEIYPETCGWINLL